MPLGLWSRERAVAGLCLAAAGLFLAAPPPAAAQDGFYDRWGNWVPLGPVDPPLVEIPDARLPPGAYMDYEDAPEVIGERAPQYDVAPGWGRRVVIVPPADLPEPGAIRRLRRDELPPELRDNPDAYVPADQLYPAYAPERQAPSRARILSVDPQAPAVVATPRSADVPADIGPAPTLQPPRAYDPEIVRPSADWGAALSALSVYAPAKRKALEIGDPWKRLEATKAVNAWLVAQSRQPATSATIRALDRLLGIATTPESTMLPGAGTEVRRPQAGGDRSFDERIAAIGARAEARRRAGDIGRPAGADTVAGVPLGADEVAGLDAFLGIGPGGPVVAGN